MSAATVSFKQGVTVDKVNIVVFFILSVAATAYFEFGLPNLVATSISDGVHKPGSKHYEGMAVDIRIWGISTIKLKKLVARIQAKLGQEYDVVLEATHIHIEYDPKEIA